MGELRRVASHDRRLARIVWEPSEEKKFAYRADHEGVLHRIGRDDLRTENQYVVVVEGQVVDHLDNWPPSWSKGLELRTELEGMLRLATSERPVTTEVIRRHLAPRTVAVSTTCLSSSSQPVAPSWSARLGQAADLAVA